MDGNNPLKNKVSCRIIKEKRRKGDTGDMKKCGYILLAVVLLIGMLCTGCTKKEESAAAPDFSFPEIQVPQEDTQQEVQNIPETDVETESEPEPEPEPQIPPLDDAAIQAKLDQIAEKYGATGMQLAVINDGQIAGLYATGWATLQETPMTPEHKLRVASISKIIIGIHTMMLQEQGVLTLDSDISQFWGTTARNPKYPDTPITIDLLLTHVSTVRAYANDGPMDYDTVRERLTYGYGTGVPGSMDSFYYNNYGFRLLGMTLELASGKSMDQYLKENLFSQMGIDAGFYPGDLQNTDLLAPLYWEGNGLARSVSTMKDMHAPAYPGADGYHYSGGLTISAAELAKIVTLLVNDGVYEGQQLLSPESVATMERYNDYELYDGTYQARPLIYAPDIYGKEGIYYHTGSGWGVYNCFSYDPNTGDGVVVLSMGAGTDAGPYGIYTVCSELNEYIYQEIA